MATTAVLPEDATTGTLLNGFERSPRSPTKTPMRHFSSAFAMASLDEAYSQKIFPVKVVAFLHFKQPLDLEQTRVVLRERLCAISRFRSRAVDTSAKKGTMECAFKEMGGEEMDKAMGRLVQEHHLIKTQTDIDGFVSQAVSENMDPDLPLWRGWVLNMAEGRSMLMLIIDHSIGDGVALVQVLMSALDGDACPGRLPSVPSRKPQAASSPGCSAQLKGLFQACWGPFIGDLMPADPPNRLKVKDHKAISPIKTFATSESLSMDQIKDIRGKLGGTVNDVLMAVTALTLQDYYRKYEPKTLKQKVRGNFPINLRSVQGTDIMSEEHFGNRFSQGQLRFPLHEEDPVKVFDNIKTQIDVIKVSPEPLVRDKILGFAVLKSGLSKNTIADLFLDAFGKVTAMLSNVPGPVDTVHFLGQPIEDLGFYAIAPVGLYFGVMQYRGGFKVGICCDAACEPEPQKLAACWKPAFERLQQAANAKGS